MKFLAGAILTFVLVLIAIIAIYVADLVSQTLIIARDAAYNALGLVTTTTTAVATTNVVGDTTMISTTIVTTTLSSFPPNAVSSKASPLVQILVVALVAVILLPLVAYAIWLRRR
jgi:cytochrome c-type biogenesis protein CcmH/NrfG